METFHHCTFYNAQISQDGWDLDGNIQWVEDVFPTDVEDILLHEEYENFDGYLDENDGESDIDDEEDYLTQKDWFILRYSMKLHSFVIYMTEQNKKEALQYFVIKQLLYWLCHVFNFFSVMISIKSNHLSVVSP